MAYVNSTTHTQTDAHMHHVLEYHIKRYKLYLLLLSLLSPSETNQCNQYPCLLIHKQTNTHSSLFKTVVEYSWPRFGPVVPCWGPTRTSVGDEGEEEAGTIMFYFSQLVLPRHRSVSLVERCDAGPAPLFTPALIMLSGFLEAYLTFLLHAFTACQVLFWRVLNLCLFI